jgi:hypothetical protein
LMDIIEEENDISHYKELTSNFAFFKDTLRKTV